MYFLVIFLKLLCKDFEKILELCCIVLERSDYVWSLCLQIYNSNLNGFINFFKINFAIFQLLSRYDDPATDYEEDLTTSNENSFGRKRKTR